ncbi:MAG: PorP/SprF family type IX secretion system membrane protein [Tannerella sp.]|jgi:type IX secretion system PorP/SprF family membrane protein|nr:PorP/SprF family type IX secretion system membrane protein [Tannerella sp.]
MRKWALLLLLSAFAALPARAQWDAWFSRYDLAMGYYNPGYAGVNGDLEVTALMKQQWIGIPRAGRPFLGQADLPLTLSNTKLGIGALLFTEPIGLFNNTLVALQLAYKHKLFGGMLSLGLQPGFASTSFDGTKVDLIGGKSPDHVAEDDAIPTTSVSGTTFDLSAGLYYTRKQFYFGLASMHLMEPQMELDENIYTYIPRSYNLTAGYNIQIKHTLFELRPSAFMMTDGQSFLADITGRVAYNKLFNFGISWRVNTSLVFLLGATIGNVEVGYAYDLPTSPLLRGSSGSHEVVLRYRINLDKGKNGNYKHKSVRIL